MNNFLENQNNLLIMLESNKSFINKYFYDYLLSILYLEFSAVKDKITNDERKELDKFYLYRKIVFFNIYYREIELVNKLFIKNIKISEINDDSDFNIFSLNVIYSKKQYNTNLSLFNLYYDNKNVPTVILNNLIYDREEDLLKLNKEIKLLTSQNRDNSLDNRLKQLYEMRRKLIKYGVSDCQKDKTNIINKHLSSISSDYDLDKNIIDSKKYIIKKMPGLIIKQQIKKF